MIKFVLRENLFSAPLNLDVILGYSFTSCVDIIKTIEFYYSSSDDIPHWIEDVATSQFDLLRKHPRLTGSSLIMCSLSRDSFLNGSYKGGGETTKKFGSQEDSINKMFDEIWNAKEDGEFKYRKLLGNKKVFNYSLEFYKSFFDLLSMILDFKVSIDDVENYLYDIDKKTGKVYGRVPITNSDPISLEKSKITKKEFQNLIYRMIYKIKYNEGPIGKLLQKKI